MYFRMTVYLSHSGVCQVLDVVWQRCSIDKMETNPDQEKTAEYEARILADAQVSLWRGIYCDGSRLGLLMDYSPHVVQPMREVLHKFHGAWHHKQKIWVVPVYRKAGYLISDLLKELDGCLASDSGHRRLDYQTGELMALYAVEHLEPFWAAMVLPDIVLHQEPEPRWVLHAPYDKAMVRHIKAPWFWSERDKFWYASGAIAETDVARSIQSRSVPTNFLRVFGSLDAYNAAPKHNGGWVPYKMDTLAYMNPYGGHSTEHRTLQVGGKKPDEIPKKMGVLTEEPDDSLLWMHGLRIKPVDAELLEKLTEQCSLRDFQVDGVAHLMSRSSALLADDMGLGKTRQAITAAMGNGGTTLIVCPATAIDNWDAEISMVDVDADPWITADNIPLDVNHPPRWMITSYERLKKIPTSIKITNLVYDEAHYIKNPAAGRTKMALTHVANAENTWLLTATPMPNSIQDIYSLMRLGGHPAAVQENIRAFKARYGSTHRGLEALNLRLNEWMLRREKSVVLDLPPKIRHEPTLFLGADDMNYYRSGLELAGDHPLQKINFVRQWLEHVKREWVYEKVIQLQDTDKAILFCNFTSSIEWYRNKFGNKAVYLDGKSSRKQRRDAMRIFQFDPSVRYFVGNIKAAGVAITLTAANHVYIVSRPWTWDDIEQAEDRAYRFGQQRRVFSVIPTVIGTLDDEIRMINMSKRHDAQKVLLQRITEKTD